MLAGTTSLLNVSLETDFMFVTIRYLSQCVLFGKKVLWIFLTTV